ncbi:protein ALP1-like [Colossoma macropomum]|uniref:protein ALP1-like n=1 Tax=Colossoma macropomum TaxID=42526 RepID=UPI001864DE7A|nr:protein ALP1-like [Colossoma macropomum]
MALETCIAFLLADELDADEYTNFKTKAPLKAREIRDDEDDDDDGEDDRKKNYFSATVPSLSVTDFQKYFQLTQTQVEELVRLLSPCEWATSKLEGWTVMHAVLASLWTLSTLESHSSVAARFHTNESLICHQLKEFCTHVTANFADKIHWPKWKEADSSVSGFSSSIGLPGTVCVVGSCVIPIERPADVPDPEAYRDSEKSYSVNLMAFCNHQGCFTYVTAEHPGSWHNSRVLLETEVGRALQEDPVNLLRGRHIIGDATFPLSEHLLTPFPDYGTLGEKKLRYNLKVQAGLKVVKGSLHVLRNKFQRLRSLQMNSITQTSLAVRTCCTLYNMYLETNNAACIECMEEHSVAQESFHELPNGHSGSLGGISKRQDIAASLGRKPKRDSTKGYYRRWYEV